MQYLLIFLMVLAHVFQSIFSKKYAVAYEKGRATDGMTPALVYAVVAGFVIGFGALVLNGFSFAPEGMTWLFGGLNAVCIFGYNVMIIETSKRGSFAVMMIMMLSTSIVLPTLMSLWVLHQDLSWVLILAICVMVASFVCINSQGGLLKDNKKGYWLCCAVFVLSNVGFSCLNILQSNLVGDGNRYEMISICYLASSLVSVVYLLLRNKKAAPAAFRMPAPAWGNAVLSGLCSTAGTSLLLYLLSVQSTAVVNTLDCGGVMIGTTLFAILFLKERPVKMQYVGLALSLVAMLLVSSADEILALFA